MQRTGKRIVIVIGLVLLAATMAAYQAGGAAMLAGQPTAVVTVNLGEVLEKLDQRATAAANLKDMAEKLQADAQKLQTEIQELEKQLKPMVEANVPVESAERQPLQERWELAKLRYAAWTQFATDKVDIEESLLLQDLYRSVKREVAQLAAASGYDVVLVDDSQGELSVNSELRVPRQTQVLQQIVNRRLLYANKTIDITDDLIQRMNNANKAAGPKPAGN